MLRNILKVPLLKSWRLRNKPTVIGIRLVSFTSGHQQKIIVSRRLPVAPSIYRYNQIRFKHAPSKTIKPFILPDIGEGINEVEVKGWLVKEGDSVEEFDGLCEVESDKATVTISSRFEGVITQLHYEVGDMAKVGKPLVDIQMSNSSDNEPGEFMNHVEKVDQDVKSQRSFGSTSPDECSPMVAPKVLQPNKGPIVTALPSARRLALEKGIDLSMIKPTGKQGQILKEDVLTFLEKSGQQQAMKYDRVGDNIGSKLETRLPLRSIQLAMFKAMTQSVKIPHFAYSDEIDMTRLVELGTISNRESEQTKLSKLAIIVKMVSLALKEYPKLNASVEESGESEELIVKHYHNIGVAIDTKVGLIVPNIKNVQTLTPSQINSELQRLRKLAYESQLGPADLSGGTITLSNIGAIGGIFGVPRLVSPEIIIGALGGIRKLPRFNSIGGIHERHIMQVVWSADHRVVDGATLGRFSNLLKQYLEGPETALLNMV